MNDSSAKRDTNILATVIATVGGIIIAIIGAYALANFGEMAATNKSIEATTTAEFMVLESVPQVSIPKLESTDEVEILVSAEDSNELSEDVTVTTTVTLPTPTPSVIQISLLVMKGMV